MVVEFIKIFRSLSSERKSDTKNPMITFSLFQNSTGSALHEKSFLNLNFQSVRLYTDNLSQECMPSILNRKKVYLH